MNLFGQSDDLMKHGRTDAADLLTPPHNHLRMQRQKLQENMIAPRPPQIRDAQRRDWRFPCRTRNQHHRRFRSRMLLNESGQIFHTPHREMLSVIIPPTITGEPRKFNGIKNQKLEKLLVQNLVSIRFVGLALPATGPEPAT